MKNKNKHLHKHSNLNANKLLTREEFKEYVFKRDNHTCIFCSKPAEDPHHIFFHK